jgi:hypothetical protein
MYTHTHTHTHTHTQHLSIFTEVFLGTGLPEPSSNYHTRDPLLLQHPPVHIQWIIFIIIIFTTLVTPCCCSTHLCIYSG